MTLQEEKKVPVDIVPDSFMPGVSKAALLAAALENYRQNNPDIPVEPGTPTLRAKNLELDREKFEYAKESDARDYNLKLAQALSRGSSGGNSNSLNFKPTANERKQFATADLLNASLQLYQDIRKTGEKYPLYYTIESLLTNPAFSEEAIRAGADVKQVVQALIRRYGGPGLKDTQSYFTKNKGQNLKNIWEDYTGKPVLQNIETDSLVEKRLTGQTGSRLNW